MKKLLAVALILVFLLPLVVHAEEGVPSWLIEGSWNHYETTDDGMLLTSLYLAENGTAYFMTQLFRSDGPGLSRSFVGSWEKTGLNSIHVITGNSASLDLTYCSFNMMFDYDLLDYYFRAELRDGDKVP